LTGTDTGIFGAAVAQSKDNNKHMILGCVKYLICIHRLS
jgi:hypothetical protein